MPDAALDHSTRALLHSLAEFTDDDARAPSLLPGWTRGHVLAHVARNADALGNLVVWARTGVETPMYPSREERDSVIEAQSGRPAAELIADVEESHERLVSAYDGLTPDQLERRVATGARRRIRPAWMIPVIRRIEVEIHHVDLGLDYTVAHWPEDFVEEVLHDIASESQTRDDLPDCILVGIEGEGEWVVGAGGQRVVGPPPALLGWMTGRSSGDGLHTPDGPLPKVGAWR